MIPYLVPAPLTDSPYDSIKLSLTHSLMIVLLFINFVSLIYTDIRISLFENQRELFRADLSPGFNRVSYFFERNLGRKLELQYRRTSNSPIYLAPSFSHNVVKSEYSHFHLLGNYDF